ncbi:MAG TPA: hypothetical protein VH741_00570 [Candidatus Limnocylindrales bacterium]
MTDTSRRPIVFALLLGLCAAFLAGPAVAGAASAGPRLVGDTLTAQVSGGERAGAWRIRIVDPTRSERIDFVLRSGDIGWSVVVRTQRRSDSGWATTARQRISGRYGDLAAASGAGAGVRWDSAAFGLPANGDGRFAITVELTRAGSYRVVTALRNAHEAFSLGPWQRVARSAITH